MEKDGLWKSSQDAFPAGTLRKSAVSKTKPSNMPNRSILFYGPAIEKEMEKLDRESSDYMNEVLSMLLDQENLKGAKKEKVLNLIDRYFLYYNSGSLGDHAQELKDDASYSLMIQALWNYNYGPWMKEMIETTRHSARELEIIFTGAS